MPMFLIRAVPLFILLLFSSPVVAEAPDYPRTVQEDGMTLRVHHPVIDRWTDYATLEGWIPVEVDETATGRTWVGAVRARATTAVDLDRRLVSLTDQAVIDTRFPDPGTPDAVVEFARQAVRSRPRDVLLDEVVQALADDFQPPVSTSDAGFDVQPPRIVVSESPLQLLRIDQRPVQAPIEGTDLEVVVNTGWNLFRHVPSDTWYVLNQGAWQSHSLLASGGWTTTTDLPQDFLSLASGSGWEAVQAALPPRRPKTEPVPFLVSLEPTELILVDGAPRLQAVTGADGLAVVSNTESDLFRTADRWYFLAAGRWFSAGALDGDWEAVAALPEVFARIPPDDGRAHVRAAVPGTVESRIAFIEATLPQMREVPADGRPAREVFFVGEPRFEPIPGTRVERAVNTPSAVLRAEDVYWLNEDVAWYRAESPAGPWRVARSVPEAIYAIPPSDPLYHVTAVRAMGEAARDGSARFQYTEAYNGRYTDGGVVVQGTGYRYPPYVSWMGPSPVYWGYPPTYGWGHPWRHPYPPYWGAYVPPTTWTVEGPGRMVGGAAAVAEQDPRLSRPGYDYTTLDQQRAAAARAAAHNPADDDLYADPAGQVYRRTDDGWSRRDEGEWSTMAELERQYGVSGPRVGAPDDVQRQAYRQNPDDIERMQRYYERRAKNYNVYSNIYVGR